jgi:hypothetical protein
MVLGSRFLYVIYEQNCNTVSGKEGQKKQCKKEVLEGNMCRICSPREQRFTFLVSKRILLSNIRLFDCLIPLHVFK